MNKISKLASTGKGKSCLIIASGTSVYKFDFDQIPNKMTRIGINFLFLPIRIDYNVFVDKSYCDFLNRSAVDPYIKYIGFKNNIRDEFRFHCNYVYNFGDVPAKNHTGYYALYIASQIMRFDKIYLIGYDYKTNENGFIHYYGDHYITPEKRRIYKERHFDDYMADFNDVKWKAKIYNLNPDSRLKKFEFKRRI